MLTKRRCTATGIINFFSKNEPYIAVGSVITGIGSAPYVWRYHGDSHSVAGTAPDWRSAVDAINAHHRFAEDEGSHDRRAA